MSEKDINRWKDAITPREKAPQPWTLGSGGSWDMQEVQPIPDEMLADLMQQYHYSGTPWNCRSLPLSPSDREYMFLLYYAMQGLVARMRIGERRIADIERQNAELVRQLTAQSADSKRLDFVIEHQTSWYPGHYNGTWQSDLKRGTLCYGKDRKQAEGQTMRDAIDQAMQAGKEPTK